MQYKVDLQKLLDWVEISANSADLTIKFELQLAIAERLEALVLELRKVNDSLGLLALGK